MKTLIAVEVDCEGPNCGDKCPTLSTSIGIGLGHDSARCGWFREKLEILHGGAIARCQSCLDGEMREQKRLTHIGADLRNTMERLVSETKQMHYFVDVLLASAGILKPGPTLEDKP